MKNCKACGVSGKTILTHRRLTAHNDDLKAQLRQVKAERASANNELRKTKRKIDKAVNLAKTSVEELKLNKVEMKVMHRQIMRLEETVKSLEWDNRRNTQEADRIKEKLRHIIDVASPRTKWLGSGCRNG